MILDLIDALRDLAARARVFDTEVGDASAGAPYKAAVRARFKTLLQAVYDRIGAVLSQL